MKTVMTMAMTMVLTAGAAWAAQPAPAGDDFVPASTLPPAESLPAAPMVMAAYVILWAALLGYVFYLWRRLQRVERDLAELERRTSRP